MSEGKVLYYGPISYSSIWILIGLLFVGVALGIIIVILYSTRRKEIRTVKTLKIHPPKVVNMNVLRDKYIKLINEAEIRFKKRQIKASQCHQQISLLVRQFYCEAMGFHADVMTLNDLKKSHHTALIELINSYYPDEFDTLEKGSVADAAERARKLVREQ